MAMDHHHHHPSTRYHHHQHVHHGQQQQHYPQQQQQQHSYGSSVSYDDDTSMSNERLSNGQPINPNDVLSGRGKLSFNHGGNKRFRDAVTASLDQYMKAETRFEKSLVVHSIIDSIHQLGGRFLKKDFDSSQWYEMSRQQCKEKVGHAIRDAVNSYEARRKKKEHTTPHVSTPAVRMSIAGNGSHCLKRRRLDSPPLTVETDYGASVRKRRRTSSQQARPPPAVPSSIMRSAAPLKPSPITSGVGMQTPDQQPRLTYSSETSGSYPHLPQQQQEHHFSFDVPIRQQRDDYPSTNQQHARKRPHDPAAHDHFELAIEAVLGPMPSRDEEDDDDASSP